MIQEISELASLRRKLLFGWKCKSRKKGCRLLLAHMHEDSSTLGAEKLIDSLFLLGHSDWEIALDNRVCMALKTRKTQMKKFAWMMMLALASGPVAFSAEKDEVVLFPYFRDNGQDGVYCAWGEDGYHFKPLNDDKPIMKPGPWEGQQLTRDPSIIYHDGLFRAVWTTNWTGRCFGAAVSKDLKEWSEPVKVEPFPKSLPEDKQPNSSWAPEICWDPAKKNYAIFWASDTPTSDGRRIFVTRTTDMKTFSDAEIFFDQGFEVIDSIIVAIPKGTAGMTEHTWLMALKYGHKPGESGQNNIRLTTAPLDLSKPWAPVGKPLIGPGSEIRPAHQAEGPALLKWNGEWLLYSDAYADGYYGLAVSTDLKTWTDKTDKLKVPAGIRHGTPFVAPRSVVAWLKKEN
jgi:Glycosyl hydrolases family 43